MYQQKNKNTKKFFGRLFPILILQNKIVATILNVIGIAVNDFKSKMDMVLNNDI